MSRESSDGFVCPTCEEMIYAEQCACDQPPCQHERRSVNFSTCYLECDECGENLLDLNGWVEPALRITR